MPQVTMPQLGEGVEQGTIGKWLKAVGDHVRIGDPIVEVVTDKVNAEVPSPFEGTLTRILVSEGDTVANDVVIAEVEVEAAAAEDDHPAADAPTAATGPAAKGPAARGPDDATRVAPPNAVGPGAAAREGAGPGAAGMTVAIGAATSQAVGVGVAEAPTSGLGADSPPTPAAPTPAAPTPVGAPAAPTPDAHALRGNGAAPAAVEIPSGIRMTPAVRRLARERGIDVTAIMGSGVGGRITRDDIVRAAAGAAPTTAGAAPTTAGAAPTTAGAAPTTAGAAPTTAGAAPTTAGAAPTTAGAAVVPTAGAAVVPTAGAAAAISTVTTHSDGASAVAGTSPSAPAGGAAHEDSPVKEGDSLKRLSPMRRAIAAHMTKFLSVPTAYITIEVDMSPVVRRRGAINGEYKAREGISLSYVAFMTKACVEALRRHHDINAHWTEEGHWRRKDINVGIAVAVPDGLVVPVIKHADGLSIHGLNVAINDLAARARDKKLRPEDLEGGTFTVDNTGWTGSILTLPIINVPEVAIITMEKIVKRPVVLEQQGDAIAIRSMMNMCIAIDHRATDGAQAGEFLGDVQRWLESVDDNTPIW